MTGARFFYAFPDTDSGFMPALCDTGEGLLPFRFSFIRKDLRRADPCRTGTKRTFEDGHGCAALFLRSVGEFSSAVV